MPDERIVSGSCTEAWWLCDEGGWPPREVPILAPYQGTRPGYERLVAAACEAGLCAGDFEEVGEGHFQVCLWDIWQRGADPAQSDEEKQRINEMQRALGVLDDDTRFVRLQIACLTRCYFTFPANIDLVLDGIGRGRPNLDARISCEPPWNNSVLPLLRQWLEHPAAGTNIIAGRRALVRAYLQILTSWSAEGDLDDLKWQLLDHVELAETIYRRLGPPTRLKLLYVRKLCWMLGYWAFDPLPRAERHERYRGLSQLYDQLIRQELGDQEDLIGPLIDRNHDNSTCHHSFFRHVDHQIAAIGAGSPVRLPGAGQERKRIHRQVTNYVHVLGSWLAHRTQEEAVEIWPPSVDTALRVYSLLGEPGPHKRWLAACLWKKLQDHHARLGRGALDYQPRRFAIPITALTV
jgi:hypothetical protein